MASFQLFVAQRQQQQWRSALSIKKRKRKREYADDIVCRPLSSSSSLSLIFTWTHAYVIKYPSHSNTSTINSGMARLFLLLDLLVRRISPNSLLIKYSRCFAHLKNIKSPFFFLRKKKRPTCWWFWMELTPTTTERNEFP